MDHGGPYGRRKNLLLAVVGTQIAATLICVFGFLVTPLWWGWVALVWGYALTWFLVTDRVKLIAYWALDRIADKSAPNRRSETASETQVAPRNQTPSRPSLASEPQVKAGDAKSRVQTDAVYLQQVRS